MNELIKFDIQISKDLIEEQRNAILEKVESGEIDALKLNTIIAMYEKVFNGDDKKNNGLKHLIKDYAIKEHEAYGVKGIIKPGCRIEKSETGVNYDFSADEVWKEIKAEEDVIAERRKAREKILKAIDPVKGHMIEVDEETGETRKIYAPLKKSTTSLKFTFK